MLALGAFELCLYGIREHLGPPRVVSQPACLVAGLVPGDEDVRHAEQHQGVGRGVGLGLGGLKIF